MARAQTCISTTRCVQKYWASFTRQLSRSSIGLTNTSTFSGGYNGLPMANVQPASGGVTNIDDWCAAAIPSAHVATRVPTNLRAVATSLVSLVYRASHAIL